MKMAEKMNLQSKVANSTLCSNTIANNYKNRIARSRAPAQMKKESQKKLRERRKK